jgi:hypothetical protein
MTISTFSPKIYPQTEKSAKNYWKAGLYVANFVCALLLIRYGKFFSDAITVPSSILVIGVFLFAGFAQLRRLADESRLKAYIEDHEGWALILLALFLIVGTVSYVAFQARLDARTVEHPKMEASVQTPGVSLEPNSAKENLAEMATPAAGEAAMASLPPVAQLETPPAPSQPALPESPSAERPHTHGRHRKAAGRRLHRRSQTRPTSPSPEYSHQTTADLPAGSR